MSGALPRSEAHRTRSELNPQRGNPFASTDSAYFPKYEDDLVVACYTESCTGYLFEDSRIRPKPLEMLQQLMISDDPVVRFRGSGVETRTQRGKLSNSMIAEQNSIEKSC